MSAARRVALVTGASGGIGRSICRRLAERGYDVAVHHHRDGDGAAESEQVVRDLGRRAKIVRGDCGDADAVTRLVAHARDSLGPVDCLVANHAVVDFNFIADLTIEQWRRAIDVNLTGTFLLVKECLPGMIDRSWGRLVALTGSLAHHGGEGFAHLSASKAGIELLVKSAACEGGSHGVTANLVSPGPTRTRLLEGVPAEWMEKKFAELPLGRFADPDDVASAVGYLASDEAASITGQTLRVNCGDVRFG